MMARNCKEGHRDLIDARKTLTKILSKMDKVEVTIRLIISSAGS